MRRWMLTVGLGVMAAVAGYVGRGAFPSADINTTLIQPKLINVTTNGWLNLDAAFDIGAVVEGEPSTRFLVLSIEAPAAETDPLPVDLALVMDVSGSMGGTKIKQAQRAAQALVEELGPQDRLGLVTFATTAQTLLDLSRSPERALIAINGLVADGSTNLAGGIRAGYGLLSEAEQGRISKVLLVSDGQPTTGESRTSKLVEQVHLHPNAALATIGIGTDYNEGLLAALADAGGAGYYYADAKTDLAAIYAKELREASTLSARGLQLSLSAGPDVQIEQVYGWPTSVVDGATQLTLGDLPAGARRKIVVKLQVGPNSDEVQLGSVHLSYSDALGERTADDSVLLTLPVVRTQAQTLNFRDRAAIAEAARAEAAAEVATAQQEWANGDAEGARRRVQVLQQRIEVQAVELGSKEMEKDAEELKSLGYLDDASAQKASSVTTRKMSR